MLRLVRWLLMGDGHMHQWKRVAAGRITGRDYTGAPIVMGRYFEYECAVCGKLKLSKLTVE